MSNMEMYQFSTNFSTWQEWLESDDDAFEVAHGATDDDSCVIEKLIDGGWYCWDSEMQDWAL